MLIYNAVFFLLLLCALLDLNDKRTFFLFLLPLVVLLILTGFRGNGGDDFFVYEQYFSSIPIALYNYGSGYFYLNVLVKHFGDYEFFIFISSLLCLSLQSFFIYFETKSPCIVLLLFYSTSFLWLDFILIRQSIAVGFFVIALSLYANNRIKTAFLFCVAAGLFHETAFFAATLIYVLSKLGRKNIFIFIFILFILSPFLSKGLVAINDITIKNKNIELYIGEHALPSMANIIELLIAMLS
ncbi:oligosaccharide repeat unit polymerase, partial [Salmonella enterica]|nr:oligosaccharide repeat unit polymerase [Salmonella enterica]